MLTNLRGKTSIMTEDYVARIGCFFVLDCFSPGVSRGIYDSARAELGEGRTLGPNVVMNEESSTRRRVSWFSASGARDLRCAARRAQTVVNVV